MFIPSMHLSVACSSNSSVSKSRAKRWIHWIASLSSRVQQQNLCRHYQRRAIPRRALNDTSWNHSQDLAALEPWQLNMNEESRWICWAKSIYNKNNNNNNIKDIFISIIDMEIWDAILQSAPLRLTKRDLTGLGGLPDFPIHAPRTSFLHPCGYIFHLTYLFEAPAPKKTNLQCCCLAVWDSCYGNMWVLCKEQRVETVAST